MSFDIVATMTCRNTRIVSLSLKKMFELLGSQELKPVSDCHPSPQYHLCEPSPDVLTSVIENERTRRLALFHQAPQKAHMSGTFYTA
jgi:hypothetical protein